MKLPGEMRQTEDISFSRVQHTIPSATLSYGSLQQVIYLPTSYGPGGVAVGVSVAVAVAVAVAAAVAVAVAVGCGAE
jgi:hypothetical protein